MSVIGSGAVYSGEVPPWLAERLAGLGKSISDLEPADLHALAAEADGIEAAAPDPPAGQKAAIAARKFVIPGAPKWANLPKLEKLPDDGWPPKFLGGDKILARVDQSAQSGIAVALDGLAATEWEAAVLPLSFYPGLQLLHLIGKVQSGELHEGMCLVGPDASDFTWLDGTSGPIHELNERRLDCFSPSEVRDYVRFFCQFVHGDEGPFRIIEPRKKGDELLPKLSRYAGRVEDDQRMLLSYEIGDRAEPLTIERFTPGGQAHVRGLVFYGENIFRALFSVDPEGLIEMVDDEPLG